jgi:hypothetical protein
MNTILCPNCQAYLGLRSEELERCPRCRTCFSAPAPHEANEAHEEASPIEADAAIGQWIVLLVSMAIMAFTVVALTNGPPNGQSKGETVWVQCGVTALILRAMWRGSTLARWLTCSAIMIGVVVTAMTSLKLSLTQPERLLVLGIPLVMVLGLASHWVSAFQARQTSKRLARSAENQRRLASPPTRTD